MLMLFKYVQLRVFRYDNQRNVKERRKGWNGNLQRTIYTVSFFNDVIVALFIINGKKRLKLSEN